MNDPTQTTKSGAVSFWPDIDPYCLLNNVLVDLIQRLDPEAVKDAKQQMEWYLAFCGEVDSILAAHARHSGEGEVSP